MSRLALINGIVYTGEDIVENQAVLIEDGRIAGIVPSKDIPDHSERIDLGGNILAPGLIDLQIYGGGGVLFAEKPQVDSLATMAEALVRSGTTSFMLTLATNTMDIFEQSVAVAKQYRHPAFMGLHFEGPYLHPSKRGAHPTACLRTPDLATLENLLENAAGTLKMMTVAPELFGAAELALLSRHGVLLSAGHSNASYDIATEGFRRGIRAVTHLYNAMSPFQHREPGLPGATFLSEDVRASIIVDGIHVAYETVAISKKIMGDRLFLITDAVEESSGGTYTHQRRGDHFALPDGTLSGSALTLLQAVQNCVQHVGIELAEALRMATLYPAQLIGAGELGQIKEGYRANLIVFDDAFEVKQVFLEGKTQLSDGLSKGGKQHDQ